MSVMYFALYWKWQVLWGSKYKEVRLFIFENLSSPGIYLALRLSIFEKFSNLILRKVVFSKGWYSHLANSRGKGGPFINFSKFFRPPGAYQDPPLISFQEKNSDQDVFAIDLLYFQFFLSENAYLTPIWSSFIRHYSSTSLINDIFVINQSKFFCF